MKIKLDTHHFEILAPLWIGILPLLLDVSRDATRDPKARKAANEELQHMARVADAYVLHRKQVEHEGA